MTIAIFFLVKFPKTLSSFILSWINNITQQKRKLLLRESWGNLKISSILWFKSKIESVSDVKIACVELS